MSAIIAVLFPRLLPEADPWGIVGNPAPPTAAPGGDAYRSAGHHARQQRPAATPVERPGVTTPFSGQVRGPLFAYPRPRSVRSADPRHPRPISLSDSGWGTEIGQDRADGGLALRRDGAGGNRMAAVIDCERAAAPGNDSTSAHRQSGGARAGPDSVQPVVGRVHRQPHHLEDPLAFAAGVEPRDAPGSEERGRCGE